MQTKYDDVAGVFGGAQGTSALTPRRPIDYLINPLLIVLLSLVTAAVYAVLLGFVPAAAAGAVAELTGLGDFWAVVWLVLRVLWVILSLGFIYSTKMPVKNRMLKQLSPRME